MELIEWILQDSNIARAIEQVKRNRGAAGIDKMTVDEVKSYFAKHGEEIKIQIRNKQYKQAYTRQKSLHTKGQWEETPTGNTHSDRPSHPTGYSPNINTGIRKIF